MLLFRLKATSTRALRALTPHPHPRHLAVGARGAGLEVQGEIIDTARALLWGWTVGATGNGRCRHRVLLSQEEKHC